MIKIMHQKVVNRQYFQSIDARENSNCCNMGGLTVCSTNNMITKKILFSTFISGEPFLLELVLL